MRSRKNTDVPEILGNPAQVSAKHQDIISSFCLTNQDRLQSLVQAIRSQHLYKEELHFGPHAHLARGNLLEAKFRETSNNVHKSCQPEPTPCGQLALTETL